MIKKFPHEVEFRKDLRNGNKYIFIDGISIGQDELPSGLEGVLSYQEFGISFSEGAQFVEFDCTNNYAIYRMEKDVVCVVAHQGSKEHYRSFLYKKL